MSKVRNLINITDLSLEEIDYLIEIADDIVAHPEQYNEILAFLVPTQVLPQKAKV